MIDYLIAKRSHPSDPTGVQKLYRFPNGYGASVVRFHGSYGFSENLWELAVVYFHSDKLDDYQITYDSGITDDVIGYLDDDQVTDYLNQIHNLKEPNHASHTP